MQVAFLFVVLLASAYATPQVKGNPLSCFLCHSIVDQLVTDAGQNVTMKILTQAVTTVCSALKMDDWCLNNLVPQLAEILKDIQAHDNTAEICGLIKLCDPAVQNHIVKIANFVAPQKVGSGSGDVFGCLLCESIMGGVENFVKANTTFTVLSQLVVKTCDSLKIEDWCMTYLIPNLQDIYDDIVKKAENPAEVCTQIKLCAEFKAQDLAVHKGIKPMKKIH